MDLPPSGREWRYYCEDCNDLGMRTWWCGEGRRQPWIEARICERRHAHGGHEWAEPCACRDTNPALVRKREAQARYAAPTAGHGRG